MRRPAGAGAGAEQSRAARRRAADRGAADPLIDGPPAEPRPAVAAVPGDDPVVEREAKERQLLVGRGDRGQSLEAPPEVVAEEPGEAAEERRRPGRLDRVAVSRAEQPARAGERVGPSGGRLDDGHGIGGEVGPARVPAWPGALEEDQSREVAEALGDVDRRFGGEIRHLQRADAGCKIEAGTGDPLLHRPIIAQGPDAPDTTDRARESMERSSVSPRGSSGRAS